MFWGFHCKICVENALSEVKTSEYIILKIGHIIARAVWFDITD